MFIHSHKLYAASKDGEILNIKKQTILKLRLLNCGYQLMTVWASKAKKMCLLQPIGLFGFVLRN